MADKTVSRVDWDRTPDHVARAHQLRSAEMGRLLSLLGCKLIGAVRRFFGFPVVPGVRRAGC
jgi:hypothetical protein